MTLMGRGLADEVINILTQEASIFVISGNTSLEQGEEGFDLQKTAKTLGVTFILTGNIRISDGVATISITLWNAVANIEVWMVELEYTEGNVFKFPVEAVARIGTSLTGQFVSWDPEHVSYVEPPDVPSWLKFVEAKAAFRIDEPMGYAKAAELAREAVAAAPEFGRARALLAQILAVTLSQSLSHDQEFDTQSALEASNAALAYMHDNHEALAQVARSLLHLGQHARAQQLAKSAEQRLRDSGPIASVLGFCNLSYGRAELAIYDFGRALRLSPGDSEVSSWLVAVGICHLILGNYDEATAHLRRAVEMSRRSFLFWLILANAYGLAGQITEGQEALARVYHLLPSFSPKIAENQWRMMFADSRVADLLTAGHAALASDPDGARSEGE